MRYFIVSMLYTQCHFRTWTIIILQAPYPLQLLVGVVFSLGYLHTVFLCTHPKYVLPVPDIPGTIAS